MSTDVVFGTSSVRRMRRMTSTPPAPRTQGVLTRIVGVTVEARGFRAPIGARCRIEAGRGESVNAEVVGFGDEVVYLMPSSATTGLMPGSRVEPVSDLYHAAVGDAVLGRVMDGTGTTMDGAGAMPTPVEWPLQGTGVNPLERAPINTALDVGVRAINGLLTVGRGQRMGLFAGSGVGKSVLLAMMTRFTEADVVVVGLIGERGREVKEFIDETLTADARARASIVAAPADASPLQRVHGAMQATAIAEYFRNQGKNVLLLMDSLTRFAQAQREIGLAVGEPPTTKGYPPSVFGRLPELVERAGNAGVGGGSITAFYTVLNEGDDMNDPVSDAARAILDGHIVLSRTLAESGHYPAIDVEASISRVLPSVTDKAHQDTIARFRRMLSKYSESKDLIQIGAYQKGSDPELDRVLRIKPKIDAYLQQSMDTCVDIASSIEDLNGVVGEPLKTKSHRNNEVDAA